MPAYSFYRSLLLLSWLQTCDVMRRLSAKAAEWLGEKTRREIGVLGMHAKTRPVISKDSRQISTLLTVRSVNISATTGIRVVVLLDLLRSQSLSLTMTTYCKYTVVSRTDSNLEVYRGSVKRISMKFYYYYIFAKLRVFEQVICSVKFISRLCCIPKDCRFRT